MEFNQNQTSSANPLHTAVLKLNNEPHDNINPKEFNINQEHQLSKVLFKAINEPNLSQLLEEETRIAKLLIYLENVCSHLEKQISEAREKIDATDDTEGINFLPGEEDDVIPGEYTKKGTYCKSTHKIREQMVKRSKLEILYAQKIDENKLTPPVHSDCFAEIDNLCDYLIQNNTEKLFTEARDCDTIRELVGPDHSTARRYQQLILDKIHCDQLIGKRKGLEIALSKLEFTYQYKLYTIHRKSADIMKAYIEKIPKHNSKKLYCRNINCKDCKHVTKPSLKTYGLQNTGSRRKKQTGPQKPRKTLLPDPQLDLQSPSPPVQSSNLLSSAHSYQSNVYLDEEDIRPQRNQGIQQEDYDHSRRHPQLDLQTPSPQSQRSHSLSSAHSCQSNVYHEEDIRPQRNQGGQQYDHDHSRRHFEPQLGLRTLSPQSQSSHSLSSAHSCQSNVYHDEDIRPPKNQGGQQDDYDHSRRHFEPQLDLRTPSPLSQRSHSLSSTHSYQSNVYHNENVRPQWDQGRQQDDYDHSRRHFDYNDSYDHTISNSAVYGDEYYKDSHPAKRKRQY